MADGVVLEVVVTRPEPASGIADRKMTAADEYGPLLAILCGVGFTALVALLLNIPSPIVLLLSLFLFPGSLFSAMVLHTKELGSPVAVLAFNAFVYSLIVYLILRRSSAFSSDKGRLANLILIAPVIVAASLACIPTMSPVWPRGMEQLKAKERKLREGLPLGVPIESARSFLQEQGVTSYEAPARNEEVIFQLAHNNNDGGRR